MQRNLLAIAVAVVATLIITVSAQAYPQGWETQAQCIHLHESTDWHKTTDWRGYPSRDHGGYQIDVGTWLVFVPRGWPSDPADATPAQQTLVTWRIYVHNGRQWGNGQWPNSARACGLR